MARIRTVKPEIWTDPDFIECSMSARLLFIALFNFASDFGVIHNRPKMLKMQCFPGDTISVEPLIEELVARRFLLERTAPDGAEVLVIRTFTQHQKVNRPTDGRWGDPSKWGHSGPSDVGDSLSTHGGLIERSVLNGTERNGTEGKGREGNNNSTLNEDSLTAPDDAESSSIIDRTIAIAAKAITDMRPDVKNQRTYERGTSKELRTKRLPEICRLLREGQTPEQVAAMLCGSNTHASHAARTLA
jgi:hypothetical protein